MKIAILGAGISGTTVARLLAGDGHEVIVLEKSERAGGLCKSTQKDGFTYDEAGGHILFSKNQEVLAWQKERCGGMPGLVETERQTKIRWHDRWVDYPFENGVGSLPKEAIVECLAGYVNSFADRKAGTPCPEDFAAWIEWRMGEGFARHFMTPYNEKIWSCDLSEMSAAWVAGRVPEAPIEDILKSAVGITTEGYTHQSVFWFPKHGGFETLVKGTVDGGGFTLRLECAVDRVERRGDGFAVNGEDFDLVINTVPLPDVAPSLVDLPGDIRQEIDALKPISLVSILLGMRVDEPLDPLSWIYLPFKDQGPANRVTYYSNYSPHVAPDGHASLMAEVTHRGELRGNQALVDDLVLGLDRAGVLEKDRVVVTDWTDNRYAYIDQNLAFPDRIAAVRKWFDQSGMITFGRFGRYEYHNSDQCIARAMEVHKHVSAIAASGDPARPKFD